MAPEATALRIAHLAVGSFRNLAPLSLQPHPRFTLIVGENGQGKTNLIEAVHYGLTLRPLRQAKLRELIRQGENSARVELTITRDDIRSHLAIDLTAQGNAVRRDLRREGKTTLAEDYLLAGASVSFTPDDMGVVRGAPERRRRLIDRATFNRWPAYLGELRIYQRLLRSRNELLRQRAQREVRESFETQLWASGARILSRRHALLDEWRPLFGEAFARIGLMADQVSLRYRGPDRPEALDQGALVLARAAAERQALDEERGFTSVGPHTDDLVFRLQGRDARLYASQGQVRALVLALKVAEIENLRQRLGHAPVLLLDDVSSELDPRRNASFMDYLRDLPSQVILTTTEDAGWHAELAGQSIRGVMSQGTVII